MAKICDKCGLRDVAATVTVGVESFDLCGEHLTELVEWLRTQDNHEEAAMQEPPVEPAPQRRRPGRPRRQ